MSRKVIIKSLIAFALLGVSGVLRAELIAICYHDVTATTNEALKDEMAVSVERLVSQFNWLQSHGYEPVSLAQVHASRNAGQPLPEKSVLLTFDDGYQSFYDKVLPLLELYGFPAVLAPVTSWIDTPAGATIDYGDRQVPRDRFLTWDQMREIAASDLVEIASHSHDLHRGIIGNPQGNTQPAATTLAYDAEARRYETPTEMLDRVRRDLATSVELIEKELGSRPRAMVWPYGEYGGKAQAVASELGMSITMTLDDLPNSSADPQRVHRLLIGSDMTLSDFALAVRDLSTPLPIRAAHVDLDYVYDADPQQQERNLSNLLDRVKAMNITTVILQAFADPDADGAADALYFPNRHLPVRADLFNRTAWQLKTRAGVEVFAWLPVLAYVTSESDHTMVESSAESAAGGYARLSPFIADNVQLITEIYEDLGASSNFSGILFHDDAIFSDFEDASAPALKFYSEQWGLPADIETIRSAHAEKFSRLKTEHLISLTMQLRDAVGAYRLSLLTARNVYAPVLLEPESEAWFAQNYQRFLEAYDFTALMAMPYLEQARRPERWLEEVVDRVASYPLGLEKTLFEFQTVDWRTGRKLSDRELATHFDILLDMGGRHIAYYPDDFVSGKPTLEMLRSRLSVNQYVALIE